MKDFAQLLEAEIPRLRRYARALTRDVVRADDLVQNCLTRALAKRHLWQPGTDLRAWLFTILHNQHVTELRRSGAYQMTVAIDDMTPVWSIKPVPSTCSSCAISEQPSASWATGSARRSCSSGSKA